MRYFSPETDSMLYYCPCCSNGKPSERLLATLDTIRDMVGFPIIVSSGPRCASHNAAVGGAERSEHLIEDNRECTGADLAIKTSGERYLILEAALQLGVRRIGVGKNLIHIGVSEDHAQNVLWTY